jgi:PST family polysaccharide transporter
MVIGIQRFASLLVTAGGGILVARLLMPEAFGLYAVISFAVGLGITFGDLGLGAALVQRRDLDPGAALAVAFTSHLALALGLAVAIVALAPALTHGLGLAQDAVAPLRCLALLVPLSAFRMPAVVLLERSMTYAPLALADTLDTLCFHGVTALAAFAGAGVWSFILGAVAARGAGLIVLCTAARWRPILRWRWADLAPVLRFGVLFQGNSLVIILRDSVVPILVTNWSGVAAVGFLNWAAAVAFLPLQVVSIAGKVLFPALSRLQDSPQEFAQATERALNRIAMVLYPTALLLLVGAEAVVRPIYGDPWVPAIPAVRLFCVSAVLGGTSTVLVHALYSLGRADTVFRLGLFWAALTWGLTVLLVPRFGFVGFAAASAGVSATGALTALALHRLVPVRIFRAVRVPLAASVASAAFFAVVARGWIRDLPSLLIGGLIAVSTYVGLACLLGGAAWRAELLEDWRRVWRPTS